jgi:catechol 2,3-dioxygenase-like lactoylglutathione lyase family enzyme
MLKYIGPIVVVDEIASSRYFYEHLLGQKVKDDFGVNVSFEGNFAIHLKSHFQSLLGDAMQYPVIKKTHNADLCFETDEIETICQGLEQEAVEFIHPIQEQPWGQRVMRLYDPDWHIVEIGETMDAVVLRYHDLGWSRDRIQAKTAMSREFVEQVIRNHRETDETR